MTDEICRLSNDEVVLTTEYTALMKTKVNSTSPNVFPSIKQLNNRKSPKPSQSGLICSQKNYPAHCVAGLSGNRIHNFFALSSHLSISGTH